MPEDYLGGIYVSGKSFMTSLSRFRPNEALQRRLEMYRVVTKWNRMLDPVEFVEHGTEPQVLHGDSVPAS